MPWNEFKRANLRMEYWPSALITRSSVRVFVNCYQKRILARIIGKQEIISEWRDCRQLHMRMCVCVCIYIYKQI
jgi:hypothetical protein